MTGGSPDELLRALADVERLAIAGLLARKPRPALELADELDLPLARVRRHLNRLQAVGLVRLEEDRRAYALDASPLRATAAAVGPSREPGVEPGDTAAADAVLRAFFRDGRLVEIPAQHAKRRVVLERLATGFERGVRYPEPEVNATLSAVHPDYAALRRYLVDEGLLEREAGVYRRT